AVAIGLAAEHPPAALVLRSPFASLADVGRLHYPYLPVRSLLEDRYDSVGRIAAVASPLLVVAGGADRIIPVQQSRQLYDAAREPKRYLEIPGADHNDAVLLAGDHVVHEILAFVRELPRG
ncbi:MAG: alpha/beta hydrolase, partial [Actinomycetota bacterium]|nr:alpha/beta hydrolase [Actinomycetota bacterium]